MSFREGKFTTAQLTEASGCKQVTFAAWRNRNGLFPHTRPDRWNLWSAVEVCVVRTIVVLTENGVPASIAVEIATQFDAYISERLAGQRTEDFIGFHRDGDGWKLLLIERTEKIQPLMYEVGAPLTIIDVHREILMPTIEKLFGGRDDR